MRFSIRLLYLYLFSFVGLIIAIIGTIRLVQLGMNIYVFRGADQYRVVEPRPTKIAPDGSEVKLTEAEVVEQERQNMEALRRDRQREVSGALSMLLVGFPLYLYHWRIIGHEKGKNI